MRDTPDLVDEFAATIPDWIDLRDVGLVTEWLCRMALTFDVRLTDLERQLDDILFRAKLERLAKFAEVGHAA